MLDWSRSPRVQPLVPILRKGGIIAYPTEAVWGLGCNPFDERAVNRLLEIKERPVEKGLILIASSMRQLQPLLYSLDDLQYQRLKNSWPGPTTWLIPHHGLVPEWISGEFSTVAVRVTNHPVAAGLCKAYGGPIVSTSCNPQGRAPARTIQEVRRYFSGELDGLTNGSVGKRASPSEIRDLLTGQVIRPS